jgi:HSP20 family protein
MATALSSRSSLQVTSQDRPRQGFAALRQEMEDLLARMWGDHDGVSWSGDFSPSLDLAETENAYEIRLDVPGLESKDIDIEVSGNIVTIRGERKEEKEEKGKSFHRVERRHGAFARTLTLPRNVNGDEAAAAYVNGVLTITLPKREDAAPKKVTVKG